MNIPESSINEILENSPSQGTLYVLLKIMKDRGMLSLVIQESLKALLRFPDDLRLRKILAEAYQEDGRLLEAETEFGKVINGMKTLAGAFRSQAEIHMLHKREPEARENLMRFISFFPEDEEAILKLEELEPVIDVPSVESPEEPEDLEITEAEEQEAFPEIITASMAETYFNQGKLDEAREIYAKLMEKNSEDSASRWRFDEISALMDQEKDVPHELPEEDSIRKRKERMISVLDAWRDNIRSLAGEGFTAG